MYFLKNKAFTYFLLILSVVSGWYFMTNTARELYPEIIVPVVAITAVYPGASAQDIEESVTDVLEESLVGGLEDIKEITSQSREGVSFISAEFQDSVDISEALIDVQDAVDEKSAELPEDAEEPTVRQVSFSDAPIFTFALSSNLAYNELRRKAEEIEEEMLKITGVSSVDISGIPEREITVVLDPQKLSQFNISPNQVVAAISNAERTFPSGSLIIDEREYRLSYESSIDTVDDVRRVVVDSLAPGNNLYVEDLTLVIEDGITTYDTQSRIGTNIEQNEIQQAIIFNVTKQEGGNIIELTDTIKETLVQYQNDHPNENLDFVTIVDGGKDINDNLSDLVGSGLQTVLIILIVMGFMVGIKESTIAATAVPLSLLLAFVGMNQIGETINFISLFSLILVIGILIDSAVVMVEGIHDRISAGDSMDEAAAHTLKEFAKPIIAGTLTTMSIFVPLLMLSGTLGQFIGGIPRVINIVLIMSLIVALIFIPAIYRLMRKVPLKDPQWLHRARAWVFDGITAWYRDFITRLLSNSFAKRGTIIGLVLLFFGSLALVGTGLIRSEFFPPDDINTFYVNVELDQGTVLESTGEAVRQVEAIVSQQDRVTSFTTTMGQESVFAGSGESGSHFANLVVIVDDKKYGNQVAEELRTKLDIIDDFRVQVLTPESGPPVGAPFQVKLQGEDWDDINTAAEQVATMVEGFEGSRDVNSGVDVGSTEIALNVIQDRLAEYNLTAFDVSSLLRTTIYGTDATSIQLGADGDVDIVVKVALDPYARTHRESNYVSFDRVKNIPIQTNRGEVLLGYFIEEEIKQATSVATHIDGKKNKTVTSYVEEGFVSDDLVTQFEEQIQDLELPEGISYELAGASDESDQASADLGSAMIFGILLIFGVLIWQFGSLRSTLFIVSVLPLGLIGVLLGLFVANVTLSFTALLGFTTLIGIVVNDSIILVDVMNKNRKNRPELSRTEAVIEGSVARLRPIILTTLSTVLGMIPLLSVSPTWEPFAYSVIIGLSFATVLTLVLIPILYNKWGR